MIIFGLTLFGVELISLLSMNHVPFETPSDFFTSALPLAELDSDERLVLDSPSFFLCLRAAVAGVQPPGTWCCSVLARAATLWGNAPIGSLCVMSNPGPSSWMSNLRWGPLGNGGGVCSCAHVCLGVKASGTWPSC